MLFVLGGQRLKIVEQLVELWECLPVVLIEVACTKMG